MLAISIWDAKPPDWVAPPGQVILSTLLGFSPHPSLDAPFLFSERTFFLFSVAQSVTDLDLNRVKSVARFDKYVNFILGAEDSTSKSDFQTMATLGSSFLELLQ